MPCSSSAHFPKKNIPSYFAMGRYSAPKVAPPCCSIVLITCDFPLFVLDSETSSCLCPFIGFAKFLFLWSGISAPSFLSFCLHLSIALMYLYKSGTVTSPLLHRQSSYPPCNVISARPIISTLQCHAGGCNWRRWRPWPRRSTNSSSTL